MSSELRAACEEAAYRTFSRCVDGVTSEGLPCLSARALLSLLGTEAAVGVQGLVFAHAARSLVYYEVTLEDMTRAYVELSITADGRKALLRRLQCVETALQRVMGNDDRWAASNECKYMFETAWVCNAESHAGSRRKTLLRSTAEKLLDLLLPGHTLALPHTESISRDVFFGTRRLVSGDTDSVPLVLRNLNL